MSDFEKSVYSELRNISRKIDLLQEEVVKLRVTSAEHHVQIHDGRKWAVTALGALGGILSAATVTLIDIFVRR